MECTSPNYVKTSEKREVEWLKTAVLRPFRAMNRSILKQSGLSRCTRQRLKVPRFLLQSAIREFNPTEFCRDAKFPCFDSDAFDVLVTCLVALGQSVRYGGFSKLDFSSDSPAS